MNLPLRLFWVIVAARFRTPVPALGPCITPFRCLPTDLDALKHMNNGNYLSILDVARLDLLIRGRIAAMLSRQGWYPVVAAETIRFRKSLKLFQSFLVETSVIGWDDKAFIVQQRFWRDEVCVAEAVVRARVLKRTGGAVAPEEVLRLAALATESAALPDWIREWNARQSD